MIIEMTPDIQVLVNSITKEFIDSIKGVPEIPEQWVSDLIKIKSLGDDLLADIGKISKKASLFPQFQKKYTKALTYFINSINQQDATPKPSSPTQKVT